MFNHFLLLCKKIKLYNINVEESCAEKKWLAFFENMKDSNRIEILLKAINRIYSKSPGMQSLIDESMIDICK